MLSDFNILCTSSEKPYYTKITVDLGSSVHFL